MGFWNNVLSAVTPAWAGGSNPFYSIRDPRLNKLLRGIGDINPRILTLQSCVDIALSWDDCPPLVSVITGKVSADLNGQIRFTKIDKNDSTEPVNVSKQPQARALTKLLAHPNPVQTWRQFRAQQKAYTQIFGFCPVLAIKPFGMSDPTSVKALWNLPPQCIKITTTGKQWYQSGAEGIIEKIEFTSNGVTTELPKEDIFFLKDQYISLYQDILPKSRISALEYPISNIIEAYKGANTMIVKRGALGILSNEAKDNIGTLPIPEGEKERIQQDYQRYGLDPDQWQIIITDASLRWQQIALPVKELMLYEAIGDGTRQICSVYNYPYGLLPKEKNDSFHNKSEDKKSLYADAIMPEADSDMEVYNNYFELEKAGIVMWLDYSHLDVFQESAKEQAEAKKVLAEGADLMYKAGAIHKNRMREILGEAAVPGEDTYYQEPQQQNTNQDEQPAATTTGAQA